MELFLKHLRASSADSGEGFKCDRCGKVFAYKYYRDKHLKYTRCVDQGDRKFPCHLCNRSFEKRDRLRIHILHVHEKHRPHKVTGLRATVLFYFLCVYVNVTVKEQLRATEIFLLGLI